MIDIHNHTLFGVDDGPENPEDSIAMLAQAQHQGVTDIICTPHYNKGDYHFPTELVEENFHTLQKAAAENGISIQLHLGCEYHVNEEIFETTASGRTPSLAGSNYILMEYSYGTPYEQIQEMTRRAVASDYIPVIAHVERYHCLATRPIRCGQLQKMGAWIQCNADALLGREGKMTAFFCRMLLKMQWVDLIASDAHDTGHRASHMQEAYELVTKTHSEDYAQWLFEKNPGRILGRE